MESKAIKLIAVGDIFLADSPLKTGRGVRSSINSNGIEYFVDKLRAILDGYDICFGNIECVLSNINYNKYNISSVEIRGESDYADIISRSGFNVVNIANNHIFQHGLEPYKDTINNLVSRGVKVIGDDYYKNNLEIVEHDGFKIGFVGYSTHYEQYHPNAEIPYSLRDKPSVILTEIKKIKAEFDGILVCSLHWGYEFLDSISIEQREFCHQLVDCGVAIILGHHSHVPQGIEKYDGALIAYSLGNFVFDMDINIARESFALEININRSGDIKYKIMPIRIENDCCPYLMGKIESDMFIDRINELSSNICIGKCLPDEKMKVIEHNANCKIASYNYKSYFKNIFKTNLFYNSQLILRALMRRIGFVRNP